MEAGKPRLMFWVIAIVVAYVPTTTNAADLTVVVENVETSDGRLQIAVNDETGYGEEGKTKPVAFGAADASSPSTTVVIEDVPPGTYAVRVRHDVNGNNKLDRNFLGIPKEPWGVSNNPGGFGLPDFVDAAFEFAEDHTLRIKLK